MENDQDALAYYTDEDIKQVSNQYSILQSEAEKINSTR